MRDASTRILAVVARRDLLYGPHSRRKPFSNKTHNFHCDPQFQRYEGPPTRHRIAIPAHGAGGLAESQQVSDAGLS